MARYKPVDRSARLLPVVLEEQIQPGTFEYALDRLVDGVLDLSRLDARFRNDETGAPAYDPRVLPKVVLLGYSRGLISSRAIERACRDNVVFIALSGDQMPAWTTIAKFVRELGDEIEPLFQEVLLVCDQLGLIGKEMFAIDGVKLPSNASKESSGTHAELAHKAKRYEKAAKKILAEHRSQDEGKGDEQRDPRQEKRVEALNREAARIRSFLQKTAPKRNARCQELKSNVTDPDSAKMATSKGVIQGYAAQAAVDSSHQVIVAAEVIGSGSEQQALLPMIEATDLFREPDTLITADAGYRSNENLKALEAQRIEALIADNGMRQRDERFKDQGRYKHGPDPLHDKSSDADNTGPKRFQPCDFAADLNNGTCICPAGKTLHQSGVPNRQNGRWNYRFKGKAEDCGPCELRGQCLRTPDRTPVRQVAIFLKGQPGPYEHTERMKQAIDSPKGRRRYGQRMGTVEPVFGNLRHNKQLNRFTLRGHKKVSTQWRLFCLVHNIEKIAGA